jgi:farnesyl-diphosphate farnesyltransferase
MWCCAVLQVLSNHMGLFLQKTNIIRDYLEDIVEEPAPRMFWPREIWGKHATQLADFKVGFH